MADNFTTLDASDASITGAADEIGGVKFPRVKLIHGADGVNDGDVSSANGLPVDATGQGDVPITLDGEEVTANLGATDNAVIDTIATNTGATKTSVDTVNTTLGSPAQAGEAASATAGLAAESGGNLDTIAGDTTSIDGKTPALGQALAAASVPVVMPAADISTLTPQTDALTDTELRATPVPVSGTVTANLSATDNAVLDNIDADTTTIAEDTTSIDGKITACNTGAVVLAAGSAAIGKLAANSGVDIGDVDITSFANGKTIKRAVISGATSGNNTVIAAVADKKIKVLSVFLIAATAVTVRFESGADGTALTGVMSVGANGGFVLPAPADPTNHWFETAANELLNMELGGAVQVSGAITYYEEA